MRKWKCIMVVAGVLAGAPYGWCAGISNEVEQALLKVDWTKVADIIQKDDGLVSDPVARLIVAHAKLATNANNEATMLFFTTGDGEDVRQWLQWAETFAKRYPDKAVALYLYADALARSGNLKEAQEILDKSLAINPQFALAWNSRGVLKAIQGDLDGALLDLSQAKRVQPNLVDAHVNLGFVGYIGRFVPKVDKDFKVYVRGFDDALKINDQCALAYLGRGCILFALGNYDEAAQDFATAHLLCPVLTAAVINYSRAEMYALHQVEVDVAMRELVAKQKPGTTLEMKTIIEAVKSQLDQRQQQLNQAVADSMRLQRLLRTDFAQATPEQIQALDKEFGRILVLGAASSQMARIQKETLDLFQEMKQMAASHQRYNIASLWSTLAKETIGAVRLGRGLYGATQATTWRELTKHVGPKAVNYAANKFLPRDGQLIVDAGLTAVTEKLLGVKLFGAYAIADTVAVITEGERRWRYDQITDIGRRIDFLVVQHSMISDNLNKAFPRSLPSPSELKKMQTQYNIQQAIALTTSPNRPLSDVGAIVKQLSSALKPGDKIAILNADPLGVRAGLIQRQSWARGLDAMVVPWNTKPDTLQQLGIKGLVGIEPVNLQQSTHRVQAAAAVAKMLDEERRRMFFPHFRFPPFPPDNDNGGGGGGAAGIGVPGRQPVIQPPSLGGLGGSIGVPNIFNQPGLPKFKLPVTPPAIPGGPPGGVAFSMAHAHQDYGNWPVITFSGLLYEAFLTQGEEKPNESKGTER